MKTPWALLTCAGLALPGIAPADDSGLLACRRIADVQQRLACYDALPVAGAGNVAQPSAAAAPAAAPPRAGKPSAVPEASPAQFGWEDRAVPAPAQVMDSSIVGRFTGWDPGDRIRLANGQVWRIADDSRAVVYRKDPKVRIRRGAFGTFYLDIEGSSQSPRVTRVE